MQKSKVNSVIQEVQAASAALKAQHEKMTFLLPLSEADHTERRRLGPRAVRTAEKRLAAAHQHCESLPASFDLKQFELDVALMTALNQCVATVTRLRGDLMDTLHGVGLRGFRSSSEAFAHIKVASANAPGLKSTVTELAVRRVKRSTKNKAPSPATPAPAGTAPVPVLVPARPASPEQQTPAPAPAPKAA